MKFKTGDTVKLINDRNGRYYQGKVINVFPKENLIRVGLVNGLYAEFPSEMWEIAERNEVSDEESEQ